MLYSEKEVFMTYKRRLLEEVSIGNDAIKALTPRSVYVTERVMKRQSPEIFGCGKKPMF